MIEPSQFRHPIQHFKWSKASFWEWLGAWWIPRWYYRLSYVVQNPRGEFRAWKRRRECPKVGEFLMYHDEGPFRVLARNGDDITIERDFGPAVVSWMNCCDPVEKS